MIKKSKFLPIGDIFEFVTNSQILGDDTNSEILKKLDELKRDKSDTKMNNGTQEILFDNELAGSLSDDTKKKIIFSILNDYYGEKPIVKKSSITKNAGRGKLAARVLGWLGKKLFTRTAAQAAGKTTAQVAANGAAQAAANGAAQAAVKPSILGKLGRYGLGTLNAAMGAQQVRSGVNDLYNGNYREGAYSLATVPFYFSSPINSLSRIAMKSTNPSLVRGAGKLVGYGMAPVNKVLAYGNSPGRSGIFGFNKNNNILKYVARHPILTTDIPLGLAGNNAAVSSDFINQAVEPLDILRDHSENFNPARYIQRNPTITGNLFSSGQTYNNAKGNSYFNF